MRTQYPLLAIALATAGCHVASSQPLSELTRTRALIEERMPSDHPSRGPLLVYASSLDQTLRHPGDAAMARSMLMATNCLGFAPEGHLVGDTRRAIDDLMTGSPARAAAYRRYVIQSSSMALTREEVECQRL